MQGLPAVPAPTKYPTLPNGKVNKFPSVNPYPVKKGLRKKVPQTTIIGVRG